MNLQLIALALAVAVSFGAGWQVQGWRYEAARAEAADQLRELQAQNAMRARDAESALEAARAEVRTEFKTITRTVDHVVENPVYRNVCLTDDGLRALAAAVGASAAPTAQPRSAVPGPEATR